MSIPGDNYREESIGIFLKRFVKIGYYCHLQTGIKFTIEKRNGCRRSIIHK